MLPELRPGKADVAADVNLGAVADRIVDDSIRIRQLCGDLAGGEDLVEFAWLEADGNHGLGWRVAVAAEPIGVHAADGAGLAAGATVEVHGSSFPFVASHHGDGGAISGWE